jgi:phenylalanine-4-hydroxylase
MPDLFHEYFGHMPLMAHQRMADLEQYTADLFLIHPTKQHDIYTLSRYSVEYGCIREDGEVKALGAGILSSPGDFDRFCA